MMDQDTVMDDEPVMLNMLAEKILPRLLSPEHVAYCPTMDLLALSNIDDQIQVFRLNGQRVFGIANKKPDCKISGLRWKPDGQLLAIAFSTLWVSLVSAQTGKAVHRIHSSAFPKARICCLGWGVNFTYRNGSGTAGTTANLDELFNRGPQVQPSNIPLDLPTELAFLDIESILPKLSALPAGGKDDELFSSRASLDAIFHASKTDSNDSTDVLFICFEDGTIYLSIYDFFEIGTFDVRQILPDLFQPIITQHTSHPYSSTHALLSVNLADKNIELRFLPLDLRLIPETGRYLSLLAAKSTQLHNILRYIQEVQAQIQSEFKASQDLPSKFIRNIEEALQEQNQCSWVQAAYHLVVTGICYPSVKEWLVDELGERGHKRWEKAASGGYENVRRFAHENLIPALERLSVLISRLRGLSRFQESTGPLGLVFEELEDVLDTVNCLQLLAHNILISAGSELRQFSAFSAWLRQEIEIQATGPSSLSADESTEKDIMLDYASILDYIQGAMLRSRLIELLNMQPETDERPSWDLEKEGRSIYDAYKRDLKTFSKGSMPERKPPGLATLVTRLESQCRIVFTRIAETQKRKVRFGDPICLEKDAGASRCYDMRMLVEDSDQCTTYFVTAALKLPFSLKTHKVTLKISNGISSTKSHELALVKLPKGTTIQDAKFIDDESIMVAFSSTTSTRLLSVPYRSNNPTTIPPLIYNPAPLSDPKPSLDLSSEYAVRSYIRHTFPAGPTWGVERLEINGRKGRRVVCCVAQDKMRYRIFDLDSGDGEEGDGDGDEDDGGEEGEGEEEMEELGGEEG